MSTTQPSAGAIRAANLIIAKMPGEPDCYSPDSIARIIESETHAGELAAQLFEAEMTLDLLAGYGLPDESPFVCFEAMKMIAAQARDKIRHRAVLAKVGGAKP